MSHNNTYPACRPKYQGWIQAFHPKCCSSFSIIHSCFGAEHRDVWNVLFKISDTPLHKYRPYTLVLGLAIIILTIITITQFSENCTHFLVYILNEKPQGDSCSVKVTSFKCELCDWLMPWLKGIHSVANYCQHKQVTFFSKHTYRWKIR